jgi:hypothetical protein
MHLAITRTLLEAPVEVTPENRIGRPLLPIRTEPSDPCIRVIQTGGLWTTPPDLA